MTGRPLGPILGSLHAAALLAATVRLRTATWRARIWAAVTVAALGRARAALADLEPPR